MSLRNRALASPVMAVWSLAVVLLLAAGSPPLQAQDQTPPEASYRISTFAGGGSGDGGPAVQAALDDPVSPTSAVRHDFHLIWPIWSTNRVCFLCLDLLGGRVVPTYPLD